MNIEIITKQDLEDFKKEIIEEIRRNSNLKKSDEEHRQWLKSYEVRKLLGISPGTLQNLRVNGSLSYTKIGGLMFYNFEDIKKLMNSGNKNQII